MGSPDLIEANRNIKSGNFYYEIGNFRVAIEKYEESLILSPDNEYAIEQVRICQDSIIINAANVAEINLEE